MKSSIKRLFVSLIYADHNSSKIVKEKIKDILDRTTDEHLVLNIGSGDNRIWPNVKNLDIIAGKNVDIIGSAEKIPLQNNSVDTIITQETFEHIKDPSVAIMECYRVLKPGGVIYFQVPFIIGYHPGPTDFTRFTREGVTELLERVGFNIDELDITVGGATGFYRIAVEFFAILFSVPIQSLYIPFKALFALLLYPIKFLDLWFSLSSQKDRIAGGYFAIATKPFRESKNLK